MEEVVIVDMKRCAFTRGGKGQLVATRLDNLSVEIIDALMKSTPQITLDMIDEVGLGQVGQAGELLNMGSAQIAQLAGIPYEASKFESNRQCGSSMEIIHRIAHAIMLGEYDIGLAIGVERMERVLTWPMHKPTPITKINPELFKHHNKWQASQSPTHSEYFKTPIPDVICQSPPLCTMPQTAQNIADMYNISREACDIFSLESHKKYGKATNAGFYQNEIVPVTVQSPVFDADFHCDYSQTGDPIELSIDEGYRANATAEQLESLKTLAGVQSLMKNPIVLTAGNACPTNDGISACILMSASKAKALGITPLAKIKATCVSGIKPQIMGIGPVIAVKKAMKKANLTAKDIDLIEFNEAFASQVIATMHELDMPHSKLNINGGSLAIGHPLGATGIRLVGTLARSLRLHDKKIGIATQCIGAGMGIATIIERC
jgi:acetyl-CoA acetyltransferase family protein